MNRIATKVSTLYVLKDFLFLLLNFEKLIITYSTFVQAVLLSRFAISELRTVRHKKNKSCLLVNVLLVYQLTENISLLSNFVSNCFVFNLSS